MKQLISIIVPTYNCGKYISQCLDSILAQSYCNWEILVVNDGSSDDSLEIIRRYESLDSRIKVIDQLNSGVVTARNNALRLAKGEYLTFVDADDRLTPDALSLMIEAMVHDMADICVGAYTLEWEQNGKRKIVNHPKTFSTPTGCFNYCITHGETFLAIKMFRTNLFKRVVNIPRDIIIQEDTIGLTQYLSHAHRATYVNQSTYIYLKRPGGVSSRMSSRHIQSLIKVAEFLHQDAFAMSIGPTINKRCAAIVIGCLRSPEISLSDKQKAYKILHALPIFSVVLAKFDCIKGRFKAFVKRIIQ